MASDKVPSPGRLWAEQLAMGLALLVAILSFMAFYHPQLLSRGGQVLTTGDLAAYGWASGLGVFLHFVCTRRGRWRPPGDCGCRSGSGFSPSASTPPRS